MDPDPIKQLQSLFTDRSKVIETISSIHSALDSIRSHAAESAPAIPEPPSSGTLSAGVPEDHVYGRLLQALRDMQAQIDRRIRPLAQEMVQFELTRLRDQSDDQRDALNQCLAKIDQNILECVSRVDEYQRRRADLLAINQRLSEFGAAPESLPADLPTADPLDAITARIEGLHLEGKL